MAKNCRKFCHFCGEGKCENKESEAECKSMNAKHKICSNASWKKYRMENCKKFCGVCGKKPQCKDKDSDCSIYVEYGFCNSDKENMKANCAKSCKFCS